MTHTLAPSEANRLHSCEAIIGRGITAFVDVGRALTEIRDAKLYRASHKTFEAYCKERWEIGRSRAYELIDQAKVTATLESAGVDLSGAPDISGRDAKALRDSPEAVAKVKARVSAGEPAAAVVKSVADEQKAAKAAQQAAWDRHQEEVRRKLNPALQRKEAVKHANGARNAAVVGQGPSGTPAGRIAELDALNAALNAKVEEQAEYIDALEKDLAAAKAEVTKFDDMAVQFEKGGFDAVKATLEERIRNLQRQVETESADKAAWKRKADFWKKTAIDLGYVSPNSTVEMNGADSVEGYAPF